MSTTKNPFTFDQLTEKGYEQINRTLSGKDALDVLRWAYETYGEELAYGCSFGAEAMVLLDLISKIKEDASVFFLDTGLHFPETYALIKHVQQTYPRLRIEMVEPDLTLTEQAAAYGDELWKHDPDMCCRKRKVEPLRQAIADKPAWLSGLRREQSPTRAHLRYVNPDNNFAKVKICPLIDWTKEDIWMYIKSFGLPYNPLHDRQYPSIGCMPCTRQVAAGEDERAGRWAGRGKTECGLHQSTN